MDNIKKGRVLRDTLYGRVRIGTAVLKSPNTTTSVGASSSSSAASSEAQPAAPQELVVVIKEYEKILVEKRQTREGHPVHEDAKNELRIHALLCREPCKHIIRLYDLRADAQCYYAVLEYAAKGEFFSFVSHPGFTRDHSRHFFKQLAAGVAFMHSKDITHRDLSLENILLDEQHILKICDFGLAKEQKDGEIQTEDAGPVGKLKYMAPEVFARRPYCAKKADIWSMGVILFIMLVQVFPFDRPTLDDDRFVHACSDRINPMLAQWQKPLLDPVVIDLLRRIFCPAEVRIDAIGILKHPYCQDPAVAASSSAAASSSTFTSQPTAAAAASSSSSSSVAPSSSSSHPPASTVAASSSAADDSMMEDTPSTQSSSSASATHPNATTAHASASASAAHAAALAMAYQRQSQQQQQQQQQQPQILESHHFEQNHPMG